MCRIKQLSTPLRLLPLAHQPVFHLINRIEHTQRTMVVGDDDDAGTLFVGDAGEVVLIASPVYQRRWISAVASEHSFGLCQDIPGATSSTLPLEVTLLDQSAKMVLDRVAVAAGRTGQLADRGPAVVLDERHDL